MMKLRHAVASKMASNFGILALTVLASSPAALAEANSNLTLDPKIHDWIYFGTNLGYADLNVKSTLRESDKSGYQLHLKALYSKYLDRWVVDAGLGYFYNKISGDDRNSPLSNPTVKTITRGFFVEISPRYRFDRNWQAGAVINGLMGSDVSFDESTQLENDKFTMLIGPRVDYEIGDDKSRWRFGAQVMTDLMISNRQLWVFQADIQYGIPLGGGESRPAPVAAPAPPPTPVRPQAPKFAEVTPERAVKIYLGEAVLRFRTAKYDLRPSSREILAKVAKYLNKYPDAWLAMRVEGHSDRRGRLAYNNRLSLNRANSVKQELSRLGVPAKKMTTKGFGPSRPIDPADDMEAYALNRRVELWLEGVKDPESITRDLNELR